MRQVWIDGMVFVKCELTHRVEVLSKEVFPHLLKGLFRKTTFDEHERSQTAVGRPQDHRSARVARPGPPDPDGAAGPAGQRGPADGVAVRRATGRVRRELLVPPAPAGEVRPRPRGRGRHRPGTAVADPQGGHQLGREQRIARGAGGRAAARPRSSTSSGSRRGERFATGSTPSRPNGSGPRCPVTSPRGSPPTNWSPSPNSCTTCSRRTSTRGDAADARPSESRPVRFFAYAYPAGSPRGRRRAPCRHRRGVLMTDLRPDRRSAKDPSPLRRADRAALVPHRRRAAGDGAAAQQPRVRPGCDRAHRRGLQHRHRDARAADRRAGRRDRPAAGAAGVRRADGGGNDRVRARPRAVAPARRAGRARRRAERWTPARCRPGTSMPSTARSGRRPEAGTGRRRDRGTDRSGGRCHRRWRAGGDLAVSRRRIDGDRAVHAVPGRRGVLAASRWCWWPPGCGRRRDRAAPAGRCAGRCAAHPGPVRGAGRPPRPAAPDRAAQRCARGRAGGGRTAGTDVVRPALRRPVGGRRPVLGARHGRVPRRRGRVCAGAAGRPAAARFGARRAGRRTARGGAAGRCRRRRCSRSPSPGTSRSTWSWRSAHRCWTN